MIGRKIEVLGGPGFVLLEDACGDDLAIVNAARQSFAKRSSEVGFAERGLIDFLMRNRHGTPFEMVDFRFVVKCPIFVAREWQRHRIASYNEVSGRYVELEPEFYVPSVSAVRRQVGKPGHYTFEPLPPQEAMRAREVLSYAYARAWAKYQELLEMGVAKELARVVLPVGIFTQFAFKANLRSLFNFISLRTAPNALFEIREYAQAIELFVAALVPVAHNAFDVNGRVAP